MESLSRHKHYKWIVLGLLFITYFTLQGVRQIYSASIPQIRSDFSALGVTAMSLGLVGTVFSFVYGLCAPCASIIADIFRRRVMIILGCLLFSSGVFLAGFSHSLINLVLAYGVINALGQCMVPSSSSAVVSEYHENTRATALSIYQSALYIGTISASLFAGQIGAMGSGMWRWCFWGIGGFGMVWAVVLFFLLKEKRDTPSSVAAPVERPTFSEVLKAFFGTPAAIFLMLAFGAMQYGDNGNRIWLTTFLTDNFSGLGPAKAAFHATFWYYIGAFVGIQIAGRLSDYFAARTPRGRFLVSVGGLCMIIPGVLLSVRCDSFTLACVGMTVWGFGGGFYDANLFAAIHDVVAPKFRASATGLFLGGGFLLGCCSPTVIGFIGDHFSMRTGMTTLSFFYAIAAVMLLIAMGCHARRKLNENV